MVGYSSIGGVPSTIGGGTGSVAAKLPKTHGGAGIRCGNETGDQARKLVGAGPIRIRNGDGLQDNPEVYAIPLDGVLASGTISARGGVQEIVSLPEILQCDILEVGFFNFQGHTPSALAALRGGFYTTPAKDDGSPYDVGTILPWTTDYAGFQGGDMILTKIPARRMFVPDVIFWIPKDKPTTDFTFDVQFRATCYWEQHSAPVEARA